ncbi:hypothetical protein PR048_015755 [Dryococelus australis]|uniref:Uncharacterized protein n=1 Tax=Dryococelus australis TaxID=614101 RepID=A0ABQ9HI54_9NEOP|nr:hypothetical protein PR048_015755 [Dryococelus australis]
MTAFRKWPFVGALGRPPTARALCVQRRLGVGRRSSRKGKEALNLHVIDVRLVRGPRRDAPVRVRVRVYDHYARVTFSWRRARARRRWWPAATGGNLGRERKLPGVISGDSDGICNSVQAHDKGAECLMTLGKWNCPSPFLTTPPTRPSQLTLGIRPFSQDAPAQFSLFSTGNLHLFEVARDVISMAETWREGDSGATPRCGIPNFNLQCTRECASSERSVHRCEFYSPELLLPRPLEVIHGQLACRGVSTSFAGTSGTAVHTRSPPTKANRVQPPAESSGFRKWESCRTMPLVGGFLWDIPFRPPLHSCASPYSLRSPTSALKILLLRVAQISSLTYYGNSSFTLAIHQQVPTLSPADLAPRVVPKSKDISEIDIICWKTFPVNEGVSISTAIISVKSATFCIVGLNVMRSMQESHLRTRHLSDAEALFFIRVPSPAESRPTLADAARGGSPSISPRTRVREALPGDRRVICYATSQEVEDNCFVSPSRAHTPSLFILRRRCENANKKGVEGARGRENIPRVGGAPSHPQIDEQWIPAFRHSHLPPQPVAQRQKIEFRTLSGAIGYVVLTGLRTPPSSRTQPQRSGLRESLASQKLSSDTHKTPYDRVKRCRGRKINIEASERVNVHQYVVEILGLFVSFSINPQVNRDGRRQSSNCHENSHAHREKQLKKHYEKLKISHEGCFRKENGIKIFSTVMFHPRPSHTLNFQYPLPSCKEMDA